MYVGYNISKIANEAPISFFLEQNKKYKLGGCAANVVANLHALECESIYLFSMIGKDSDGTILQELTQTLIQNKIIESDPPTTIKNRYYCNNQIIFRHDKETTICIRKDQEDFIIDQFNTLINMN